MILVRDFLADQRIVRPTRAPAAPRVSVVLPTFRRCASGRLRRAVASVLGQSLGDLELLVVDDGSTDGTRELVLGLQAEDPRIVYVRHERNCGLPALRVNEGIELARGRFLAFQFDDDSWTPGALAGLVGAAEACPGPAMVCGLAVLHLPGGRRLELPDVRQIDAEALRGHNRIAPQHPLERRPQPAAARPGRPVREHVAPGGGE